MPKKIIGILSVGRADYSYFKPIMEEIRKDASLKYFLIVTGMHLSPEFGQAYKEIIKDGFRIGAKIEATLSSDSPEGTAKTTGLITLGFTSVLNRNPFDVLLVLGDRYETLGALMAAMPYNILIAHIFGGEITEGQMDEQVRHAITKISHIHFAANRLSAKRIIQMGEEPWRVFVTGSPSVDSIKQTALYARKDFFNLFNFDPSMKLFLVTFHPATLDCKDVVTHTSNLLNALSRFRANILFTYPNSDYGSRKIISAITDFTKKNKNARFIKNLGMKNYYSAMKYADAIVGNSSSGIIESATFKAPVVNIGNRQKNRLAGGNVIHSGYGPEEIIKKINIALSDSFKAKLAKIGNPYGEGGSSKKIIKILKQALSYKEKSRLSIKKFCLK